MGKGQKTCDTCGTSTGPRAYMCAKCNAPFVFKAKSKESKNTKIIRNVNWKELIKGDRIRVGGGPYYVSGADFIPMGYRGRFIVEGVDHNGIKAWGLDKHNGFCHIWMNGDVHNKETNLYKTPHKLIKLKLKVVT